jgi:hypothetical protein
VEKKREGRKITTKPYFEKMRDLGKQLRRPKGEDVGEQHPDRGSDDGDRG